MRVLIAFGSKRGGTAGLADMIGDALREVGCETVVSPATGIYDLTAFDAVIVAYLHVVPAELAAVLQRAADAPAPGGRMTPQMIIDMLRGLQIMRAERVYRPVASDGAIVEAVDTLVTARTQ